MIHCFDKAPDGSTNRSRITFLFQIAHTHGLC